MSTEPEVQAKPKSKDRRGDRHRDYIWVEVKPAEREKLERMVAARGPWATRAGVMRQLLMEAKE